MPYGRHVREDNSSSQEAAERRGYFYRTIEEHIDRFAKEASAENSVADIADWVGQRLRAKAKALWEQHRATELLLEMRENGTAAGERTGYTSRRAARTPVSSRSSAGRALNGDERITLRRADLNRPKDPKKILKIWKMLHAGKNIEQIADKFGVTNGAIYLQVKRWDLLNNRQPHFNGVKAPQKVGRPSNYQPGRDRRDRVEWIRALAAKGMTPKEIGKKVGISAAGVYWNAKHNNIQLVKPNMSKVTKAAIAKRRALNWTQRPENKAKIAERMRKMREAKAAKEKGATA